jgi:hypothetical protein
VATSLQQRVRDLPPELRMAAGGAAALAFSLILPWYQKSYVPPGRSDFAQDNLSAFGVFSFVEAAVLLVAAGVLYLVWARSERKAFHLPGGDGFVISLAGGWALALLVWRLFDKPDVDGASATVGIQWGIFFAMAAAATLVVAGARVRAAHRPEPPNPAEQEVWEQPPPRQRDDARREPRDVTAVTEVLRERPDWAGEPPEAPGRTSRAPEPPPPEPAPAEEIRASRERRSEPNQPPQPDRLF